MAKAAGKYRGRAPALTAEDAVRARALVSAGVPKTRVARELGVNRSTVYRLLTQDPHRERDDT
ncbi:MAG: Hin recombinase [Actinobacteria bacterium]|nr:Hin recombinase [Actinomycetota bacterium]